MEAAVRTVVREAAERDDAPEGAELFEWFVTALWPEVRIPLERGEGFEPCDCSDEDPYLRPSDMVTIKAEYAGRLGTFSLGKGFRNYVYWVGWNRRERVGVLAVGPTKTKELPR